MEKVQKQSPISNSDYVDFLKEQLSAFEEFERRLVATDPEEIHHDLFDCFQENLQMIRDDIKFFDDYFTYDPG
jgi:hypothetical protein